MKLKRRRIILIASLCMAIYVGGYVTCRVTGSIIHESGYRTDAGKLVVAEHRVDVGGGVAEAPRNPIPAMLFTPMRWMEQAAWYVVKPVGSEWGE